MSRSRIWIVRWTSSTAKRPAVSDGTAKRIHLALGGVGYEASLACRKHLRGVLIGSGLELVDRRATTDETRAVHDCEQARSRPLTRSSRYPSGVRTIARYATLAEYQSVRVSCAPPSLLPDGRPTHRACGGRRCAPSLSPRRPCHRRSSCSAKGERHTFERLRSALVSRSLSTTTNLSSRQARVTKLDYGWWEVPVTHPSACDSCINQRRRGVSPSYPSRAASTAG